MKKPTIINLFGGPGAGKSTSAAFIFAELKMRGVDCELVREFAKYKTWERNLKIFDNQTYIFGKQSYKMSILHGEVDVVITDSPLMLSVIYETTSEHLKNHVMELFNSYNNINYFIERTNPYKINGRHQDEKEAIKLDQKVISCLELNDISFKYINSNREGYKYIVNDVMNS